METLPNQAASESALAVAADSHDTPTPACTSCPHFDEVTRRLIDAIDRGFLQMSAAILHGKREPFGGPPVDDAVRDAIETRSQIIKAMSRGQS